MAVSVRFSECWITAVIDRVGTVIRILLPMHLVQFHFIL